MVSLGDRGLDLVLGGGIGKIRRSGDKTASVLLIRGPAGSGKTLVGFHAALALSKQYPGPVAYACIELLPTELEAQVLAFRDAPAGVAFRYPGARPRSPHRESDVIVDARVLDLSRGPDALGNELEQFWSAPGGDGSPPGVLVIDSLIEGYGVGSSASREFADAVCKLAAHWGIALVLLEESLPGTPSPWIYAVDTVLELGVVAEDVEATRAAPFERQLMVRKHRFGPSDAGPHRFLLEPGKTVTVLPRPSAWLEPWTATLAVGVSADNALSTQGLWIPNGGQGKGMQIEGAMVAAVFGSIPRTVFSVGNAIVGQPKSSRKELHISFTVPLGTTDQTRTATGKLALGVGHPYLSAHRFLRVALDTVAGDAGIDRVVIADLRVLRSLWDTAGLRRAIGVFCQLMRRHRIPVILIESTPNRQNVTPIPQGAVLQGWEPGLDVPATVDFADVSVEVVENARNPPGERVIATNLRTGHTESWTT